MIVVTGATGQLGRSVVTRLLEKLPATELTVSVRDPGQAQDLADRGVRVRRGDFTDPSTLPAAFAGATQVLLISGPAAHEPHRAAIEAAKDAGAERVVYTSHMGASTDSLFLPTRGHAQTEHDLEASGLRFTALRNGFYASTAAMLLSRAVETGELRLPEDGPVSWTAHADLADAAVIALTEDGRLDGVTPRLTGAESLDFNDVAAIGAELTGRRITRVTVSDEDYRESMLASGAPPFVADLMLGMFAASRRGEFAAVDPTLGELLGRPTTPLRDVLRSSLAG